MFNFESIFKKSMSVIARFCALLFLLFSAQLVYSQSQYKDPVDLLFDLPEFQNLDGGGKIWDPVVGFTLDTGSEYIDWIEKFSLNYNRLIRINNITEDAITKTTNQITTLISDNKNYFVKTKNGNFILSKSATKSVKNTYKTLNNNILRFTGTRKSLQSLSKSQLFKAITKDNKGLELGRGAKILKYGGSIFSVYFTASTIKELIDAKNNNENQKVSNRIQELFASAGVMAAGLAGATVWPLTVGIASGSYINSLSENLDDSRMEAFKNSMRLNYSEESLRENISKKIIDKAKSEYFYLGHVKTQGKFENQIRADIKQIIINFIDEMILKTDIDRASMRRILGTLITEQQGKEDAILIDTAKKFKDAKVDHSYLQNHIEIAWSLYIAVMDAISLQFPVSSCPSLEVCA